MLKNLFKKRKKKRVICGAEAIFTHIQSTIDINISTYIVILYADQKHTLGLSSDFELPRGKKDKETGRWANEKFYINEKEFATFEQFKSEAHIGNELFANIQSGIEIIEVDGEVPYILHDFEDYIVIDE
ncbi:MAG: hypothetical protein FWC89_10095 [Defluviitaleaceae bacterium]|nr:hypothetical protein [Defluviitaleaceae bacterium]